MDSYYPSKETKQYIEFENKFLLFVTFKKHTLAQQRIKDLLKIKIWKKIFQENATRNQAGICSDTSFIF